MQPSYEEEDLQNTQDLVKQRQRYFRRPKRTADLLGQLMARKGYGQQETQHDLGQVWLQLVDQRMVTKTRIGNIRAGILEVLVDSSAARQQLEFQKRSLIKQLNQKLPTSKIKNIRFKVTKLQ